jgi:hypothetical protein
VVLKGTVVHTYNPSTGDAEAGEFRVLYYPELQSETLSQKQNKQNPVVLCQAHQVLFRHRILTENVLGIPWCSLVFYWWECLLLTQGPTAKWQTQNWKPRLCGMQTQALNHWAVEVKQPGAFCCAPACSVILSDSKSFCYFSDLAPLFLALPLLSHISTSVAVSGGLMLSGSTYSSRSHLSP